MNNQTASGPAHKTHLPNKAYDISKPHKPVTPFDSNDEINRLFALNEGIETIAVVNENVPIGLINRNYFMEQFARPFARDLFGKRSCKTFMEPHPIIVDHETLLEKLLTIVVNTGEGALKNGFIATENGKYHSIGTGFDLISAMSDIEAEKTRQMLSSINYASMIQQAHLAESNRTIESIPDHGILWEPRDVVGGDAYFFRDTPQGFVGCTFDCTGHGVPGAFMTLIILSFLEQAFDGTDASVPVGEVLTRMNKYVKRVLQQRVVYSAEDPSVGKKSNDGLDAALFLLPKDHSKVTYASARLTLMVTDTEGKVSSYEGDRDGIGYQDTSEDAVFKTYDLILPAGALLTIPSDGVIDQLGGPKHIAHGKKRLERFLSENYFLTAKDLTKQFKTHFDLWQGTQRRRDDVSLLNIRNSGGQYGN
jgi:serine phosphatase RsbU (regulator of sigma subunit)